MSWVVRNTLRQWNIRSLGDDSCYEDLISIERGIKELIEMGKLTPLEVIVIRFIQGGGYPVDGKRALGKHRITVTRAFRRACKKIADHLGDYFTDDGYLKYIKEKYPSLSEEKLKILKEVMRR
jgi:hypothetical protein